MLFEALSTKAMTQLDVGVLHQVRVNFFPGLVVIAYFFTVHANRQDSFEGLDIVQGFLKITVALSQGFFKFYHSPANFDPRKFLKEATKGMAGICKARYEAFGCAGMASKITPLSLETMFGRYTSGELDPKIN